MMNRKGFLKRVAGALGALFGAGAISELAVPDHEVVLSHDYCNTDTIRLIEENCAQEADYLYELVAYEWNPSAEVGEWVARIAEKSPDLPDYLRDPITISVT